MKKLALLMVFVLVFSVSCVLATDAVAPLSGEAISGELLVESGETESTEPEDAVVGENEVISGEDETVSGEMVDINDTTTNSDEAIEDEAIETSNNSATIGAIIAIVIVVAVVAIAAILRKD